MVLLLARLACRLGILLLAGAVAWPFFFGIARQNEDEAVVAELKRAAKDGRADEAIRKALNERELDDAADYLRLADHLKLSTSSELRVKVRDATAADESLGGKVARCARGVFGGDMKSVLSATCTIAADFTPVGDIRDIVIHGASMVAGKDYDKIVLGLSVLGLGATGLSFVSAGTAAPVAAPAKAGITVLKVAKRGGYVSRALMRSIGKGGAPKLMRAADEINDVRRRFGNAEAVRMLRHADDVEDIGSVAKMYGKFGAKARPIMALTGKTAISAFKATYKVADAAAVPALLFLAAGFAGLLALSLRRWILRASFA